MSLSGLKTVGLSSVKKKSSHENNKLPLMLMHWEIRGTVFE